MGLRNRGPASPQNRTSKGSGSPMSSVQQRGMQPTGLEQASQGIINARNPRGLGTLKISEVVGIGNGLEEIRPDG